MAHHYGLPIVVERDPETGEPCSFVWRGVTYLVDEVYSRWHLRDRWWEASNPDHPRGGTTDRVYYRVMSRLREFGSLAVFEIYFDRAQNVWVLDFVHD
jgi:hypothetical protein